MSVFQGGPVVGELPLKFTVVTSFAAFKKFSSQTELSLYVLEKDAFMRGSSLTDASAGRDQQFNKTMVYFQLNRRGGRIFERETGSHIGKRIAIVLDNQVQSAPNVISQISTSGQIEMGNSPMTEARDLALVLRAGALPAPIRIVEQRSVGPALGQDSVDKGKLAGIIGLALVFIVALMYFLPNAWVEKI